MYNVTISYSYANLAVPGALPGFPLVEFWEPNEVWLVEEYDGYVYATRRGDRYGYEGDNRFDFYPEHVVAEGIWERNTTEDIQSRELIFCGRAGDHRLDIRSTITGTSSGFVLTWDAAASCGSRAEPGATAHIRAAGLLNCEIEPIYCNRINAATP